MMDENALPLSRLCIHQVTLPEQHDFRESIECLSRNEITLTAVWRPKLEAVGARTAARILDDNGVKAIS